MSWTSMRSGQKIFGEKGSILKDHLGVEQIGTSHQGGFFLHKPLSARIHIRVKTSKRLGSINIYGENCIIAVIKD